MSDKLGNTDHPVDEPRSTGDGPPSAGKVYRGVNKSLAKRLELLGTEVSSLKERVRELESAMHILIDGLEERFKVSSGLKDEKREY